MSAGTYALFAATALMIQASVLLALEARTWLGAAMAVVLTGWALLVAGKAR